MKITKDGKEIEVTEKAYNVVYASLGYTPVKEGGTGAKRGSKKTAADKDSEA